MSKVEVKVNIDPVYVINTKLGLKENGPIHSFFTETCATHMDKYVPATKDLTLASSEFHTTDEIHYRTPYAHYIYEGKAMGPSIPIKDESGRIVRWFSKGPKYYTGKDLVIKTGVHEKATSHWAEKMWTAESEDILKEVAEAIKKRGK